MVYDDYIQAVDYMVNAIANGKYLYFQTSYISENKYEKMDLKKFDKKIIDKYNADLSKSERLSCRRRNQARFIYVRFRNQIIILKTNGESDIAKNEKWRDIRNDKLEIKVGATTSYLVGVGKKKKKKGNSLDTKIQVFVNSETLKEIKLACKNAISIQKSIPLFIYEWSKTNGLVAWSGVNAQRMQLKEELVRVLVQRFGMKTTQAKKMMRVNTFKARKMKKLDEKIIEKYFDNVLKEVDTSI